MILQNINIHKILGLLPASTSAEAPVTGRRSLTIRAQRRRAVRRATARKHLLRRRGRLVTVKHCGSSRTGHGVQQLPIRPIKRNEIARYMGQEGVAVPGIGIQRPELSHPNEDRLKSKKKKRGVTNKYKKKGDNLKGL